MAQMTQMKTEKTERGVEMEEGGLVWGRGRD